MDFNEIQYLIDTGKDIPPLSEAALGLLECLRALDYRVTKLESAKAAEPNPPKSGNELEKAAKRYAKKRPDAWDMSPAETEKEFEKAFTAGARWAAKNATQGSRNQPTECPCVFCERSHAEHEAFRDGYLAGLRGDDFDTNPHDDEPWNREAWDDGWKLGRAEWERYNPEPDEQEGE